MSYYVDVAELEKVRTQKGLKTDIALERASGVNRNTIASVTENGKRPGSRTIEKLAIALELTPEQTGAIFFAHQLT